MADKLAFTDVTRSAEPARLAGVPYEFSSQPIDELIEQGVKAILADSGMSQPFCGTKSRPHVLFPDLRLCMRCGFFAPKMPR